MSRTIGRAAGIRVVFRGNEASTNGKVIVLPALDHTVDYTKEQVQVARGYTDHEAAHLILTDMAQYQEAAAQGGELFAFTLNAMEDIRIERELTKKYPGTAQNLCATTVAVNSEFLREYAGKPEVTGNAKRILPLAITWEGRKRLGYPTSTNDECLASVSEEVRKAASRICDALEACHSTGDCITLAGAVCDELDPQGQHKQVRVVGKSRPGNPARGNVSSGAAKGKGKKDGEAPGGKGGKGDQPGELPGSGGGNPGTDSPLPVGLTPEKLAELLGNDAGPGESLDPYLAEPYRPFTTEADELVDAVPSADPSLSYADLLPAGAVSVMRRKLERALLAKQNRAWLGGHQEGRLDSRRLVSALAGRPNVYKQREEDEEIDTALALLVDLSGSMRNGDGAVSKAECAAKTAVALSEAVDKTGVVYGVFGFQNRGFTGQLADDLRNATDRGERFGRLSRLRTIIFKGFDEPLVRAHRKLVTMPTLAGGDNSDGDHVAIIAGLLKKRPERRKILMVLSDGLPSTRTSFDTAHLGGHLLAEVEAAERAGIVVVGIGIMTDGPRRYYQRFALVNNPMDLAGTVMDEVAQVMLGERSALLMRKAS
ncbi:hypothetical protein [Azospirillum sp. TSH7]|uniref:cobaltochelatase CobT-related protein n=1 Tax=Azospirillum sp. TSH7 TaxID=652751 RepID=UPI000D606A9C|nr:hypothetical protein [Azospirillum sp. TSH7]PWC64012.1 hypothetical protein TSH20_19165 [Azospirillum sp. TSH20]